MWYKNRKRRIKYYENLNKKVIDNENIYEEKKVIFSDNVKTIISHIPENNELKINELDKKKDEMELLELLNELIKIDDCDKKKLKRNYWNYMKIFVEYNLFNFIYNKKNLNSIIIIFFKIYY